MPREPLAGGLNPPGAGDRPQHGDLPPSSLAVQLVQRFTNTHAAKRPKIQDQEAFRQLLQEVLGTAAHKAGSPDTLENDVDVNSKLIYVIVKAGLDSISSQSPFESGSDSYQQVTDSLAALEITINRCPEVLFVTSQNHETQPVGAGQLYQWLLPRLLEFLTKPNLQPGKKGIESLLKSCILKEESLRLSQVKYRPILTYLKICIEDLVDFLESPTRKSLSLPSSSTLENQEKDSAGQNLTENIPRVKITSHVQALPLIAGLLYVVADIDGNISGGPSTVQLNSPRRAWVLGIVSRLWQTLADVGRQSDFEEGFVSCLLAMADFLRFNITQCLISKSEFVVLSRSSLLLSQILMCILTTPSFSVLSSSFKRLERQICLSLIDLAHGVRISSALSRVLNDVLLPSLLQIKDDSIPIEPLSADLQQAIDLFVNVQHEGTESTMNHTTSIQIPTFQDADLLQTARQYFQQINLDSGGDGSLRAVKRTRLSKEDTQNLTVTELFTLAPEIPRMLDIEIEAKDQDASGLIVERYSSLSENEQSQLFSNLGLLACKIGAGAENIFSQTRAPNPSPLNFTRCLLCDGDNRYPILAEPNAASQRQPISHLLSELIRLSREQKFRRPRISAMMAIGRVLSHTTNEQHLNLATSIFGQWCLQSLQSSSRELRIAAGRILPVFLRESLDFLIYSKNRPIALDYLRTLSDRGDLMLQETCVLAWSQIAKCLDDGREMNLVLLKLVEYLGHTNALICGVAFDELQRICNHSPFSAIKLFAPYWRSIAVTVVKDIHKRPQIVQQISDLLAMSVSEFLVLTQVYTIPFFVLTKKQDILQRIAEACGRSTMALCREHNNLAAILANILLQSSNDAENLVMALLNAVSPEFIHVDCTELLRSEPQATAAELLKSAGEDDETKKLKAHQALQHLANVTQSKQGSSRGGTPKPNLLGLFFENHVLGIMAILADTINDGRGPQPRLDKIVCLKAIGEMVSVAKGHVSNGLPQICACLRSAIVSGDLANHAFQAWIVMIETLEEDDIANLIDPTFAIMVQFWDGFLPQTQGQAYKMVSRLLSLHGILIKDLSNTLPSISGISVMSKFDNEIKKFKAQMDVKQHFQAFAQRLQNENATVITSALTELATYLEGNQAWLQEATISELPDPVVNMLIRTLLDTSILFNESNTDISVLCAKCLGLVGCLDPTTVEAVREKKQILILSNFTDHEEVRDFIIFFLREVLVKAFLSSTNSRSQGFLAYAMQELLGLGDFPASVGPGSRNESYDGNTQRWNSLPESTRTVLIPFLDSKYFVTAGVAQSAPVYPLFKPETSHRQWLRTFAYDLLKREIGEVMTQRLFSVLSRIIRSQDTALPEFLLPFAVLNVVLSGSEKGRSDITQEVLAILNQPLVENSTLKENIILCSQSIFHVLDYLTRWMQEKKKQLSRIKNPSSRARHPTEEEIEQDLIQISSLEAVLNLIPADVISRRAIECKSFSRALFHWEQYMRQEAQKHSEINQALDQEPLFERLQDIYTQIDEPDGIEGISAHLQVLNIDQQILEHRKAGRWSAAQSWYEILLTERPNDIEIQYNLLTSLRESGQYDSLLSRVQGFEQSDASKAVSLPFAAEASWITAKWTKLKTFTEQYGQVGGENFNVGIGRALVALANLEMESFTTILDDLRRTTVRGLSATNTSSLQTCHDEMLRFHVLTEIDAISRFRSEDESERSRFMTTLDRRLRIVGPFLADKQYILGIRRAVMLLCLQYMKSDISPVWLMSAQLARKGGFTDQAFDAVLHASQLGDESATIEHSRLLWRAGNHRKAIQSLDGAIAANAFRSHDHMMSDELMTTSNAATTSNVLKARAYLLLAKWVDRAGQTQSDAIIHQYKRVTEAHPRWEKGHYYLGKHYNKLLESEKAKPPSKQAQTYISGETAKLVVENYLRSLAFGAKYIYQTLPKILTLWLGLGYETEQPLDIKYGNDEGFRAHIVSLRRKLLSACNSQVKKYTDRLPAWAFYTALPQIVARICHPNQAVYNALLEIVAKVVIQHTPQALWTLLAMVKSSSKDRASRGAACVTRVLENARKEKKNVGVEMKTWITQGQKLSEQLLQVCEGDIQGKASHISLSRDLGFNHKAAICKLAVPFESELAATLPAANAGMRQHKAFGESDYVYISSFLDDVLVLNSLQKPRKINIRGSDGRVYAMLCKPKDDLRKDQRLMEFNAMINRSLKKDAESSKRRLHIKTYAVTPLNEECGLIEWVDNLKTLRDILLASYKQKGVVINYQEIRQLLNEAVSAPEKLPIFTNRIVPYFAPVFHEWFVEMFPEPDAWFTARLRYTRSCAVMSIVGHVLGLGDRHGENILFEEGTGGTLHVDFNCLFDKGLTFEKPELVPFRLTHNMIDAFGAQGYEGPFRKSCELTLCILRGNEDTLMTILETFLYDPTTDFIGKKKKVNSLVPTTPEGVLENVRNKVHGLLAGESVPLSIEGYTDEQIRQATDPWNLASMYIGWCAFF